MQKCDDYRVPWGYYDKFNAINDKYLPAMGEGENMATQLVTAINKLVYKWYNDGDVYDNTFALQGWANDLSSYANWIYKHFNESKGTLNKIETAIHDRDYEFILKDLADNFLDEKLLAELSQKEKTSSIYECTGKFKFVYYEDEEDDYDDYDDEDYDDEM